MTEALKKRVERLEKEKAPPITLEGKEIIDLLHQGEPFIEHPERYPSDPEEDRRMLKDFLESDEARASKRRREVQVI